MLQLASLFKRSFKPEPSGIRYQVLGECEDNRAIAAARGMFWTVIAALVISAVVQVLVR